MKTPRISASSYSNTAPLIWPFLYGSQHGKVEVILDNAPRRSAALLSQGRVDAALAPVIAYQEIEGVRLVPEVCVGAKEKVSSVCLVTRGMDLEKVGSVSLDVSSRTSVALTKIIFREFLGFEPTWRSADPVIGDMLIESDCALIIGDPALSMMNPEPGGSSYRKFDIVELWKRHTGLGFIFAMWMTQDDTCSIDFAGARDEGLEHLDEIVSNYAYEIPFSRSELRKYLNENVVYSTEGPMLSGMDLFFDLAEKNRLIDRKKPPVYT